MDRVLIWDEQEDNLEELKTRLENLNQFKVETVVTLEAAKEVLGDKPVSVLVLNLTGDYLEKLEFISFMTRYYWSVPCIVMIDSLVDDILKKNQQQILQLIPKPLEYKVLVSAIFSTLYLKDEGLAHSGMSLINFLMLLQYANLTCRLEIRAPGGLKGYFYFLQGELLDAHYNNLHGNQAVSELVKWEKVMVFFRELPQRRTRKRFKKNLMEIIEQI